MGTLKVLFVSKLVELITVTLFANSRRRSRVGKDYECNLLCIIILLVVLTAYVA